MRFAQACRVKLTLHQNSIANEEEFSILRDEEFFSKPTSEIIHLKNKIKELKKDNSLALLLKIFYSFKDQNQGAAFRLIKDFLELDPWLDVQHWGSLSYRTDKKLLINFEKLILKIKQDISSMDPRFWKLVSMKLDQYLPSAIKNRVEKTFDIKFTLNEIREISKSALYGKPYFFLWAQELANRSSFKETQSYLSLISWDQWRKAEWTLAELFIITPHNRKPFIKRLSQLRKQNPHLFFRILNNKKFRNLLLVNKVKAYPGFRAERFYYKENLMGKNYYFHLFKLMELGDLNSNYLR